LWQPAQPKQTKKTNPKTSHNPKNKAQEVVVHSNQSTTTTKQKQNNHTKNNKK
jgi:hypothetical protein